MISSNTARIWRATRYRRAGMRWLSCTVSVLFMLGADAPAQAQDITVNAVMRHVHALTVDIGPRPYHSEAARRAAAYIEAELKRAGLQVQRQIPGQVSLPAISVGSRRFYTAGHTSLMDPNLWVALGPDVTRDRSGLLIIAHYDTVSRSPGAVDNAVSVGIGIELARALATQPLPRPVLIAFTAAEEYRLAGAHALARQLAPDVGLAVSMDLIGSPGNLTLNGLSSRMGVSWLRYIASTADRAGIDIHAPIPHRVISRHLPQIERSDHGAFAMAGVPAFHLYHRGPDAIYLPYHTALDTADRVDPASIRETAAFLTSLAYRSDTFPTSGGDPGLWVPGTHIVLPVWLVWTVICLLAIGIGFGLIALFHNRSRQRGPGLMIALFVYAIAWMLSFWLSTIASAKAGHPMPWVHHPGVFTLLMCAMALALSGLLFGLCGRWKTPAGTNRYLMSALVLYLAAGLVFALLNVPELAWIPLLMGLLSAAMCWTRSMVATVGLFAASLIPLWAPLDPAFMREAVHNGFWTADIPLAGFLSIVILPAALSAMYLAQRFGPISQPRLGLPRSWTAHGWLLVCAATVALALVLLAIQEPACSGDDFQFHRLTCELSGIAGDRH